MASVSFLTSSRSPHLRNISILLILCWSSLCIQYTRGGSSYLGEKCTKNLDCEDTAYCDDNQECSCKSIPGKLYPRYNSGKKICESLVGSLCTRREDEKGWKCVDDAECTPKPGVHPLTLGICECKPDFFAKDGICGNHKITVEDFKKRPRDDHASVPWAARSGSLTVKNSVSWIFYSTLIPSLLLSIVWLLHY